MPSRIAYFFSAAILIFIPVKASAVEFMTEAERRAQYVELEERARKRSEPPHVRQVDPMQVSAVSTKGTNPKKAVARATKDIVNEPRAYKYDPGTIVIKTGARTLHFIEDDGTMTTFPIAVGREGAQWFGTTHVTHKRKNPEWRPTPNMRKKNPKLPVVMKPGPKNPLGIRAIYLAEGYLRIHGTNEPSSIGKAASSGCYRMLNEHVSILYEKVASGAKVVVLR